MLLIKMVSCILPNNFGICLFTENQISGMSVPTFYKRQLIWRNHFSSSGWTVLWKATSSRGAIRYTDFLRRPAIGRSSAKQAGHRVP